MQQLTGLKRLACRVVSLERLAAAENVKVASLEQH
jgi:hypothetical protein